MHPSALQQLVVDTYAVHYVLWNLGIDPNEIFVQALFISNAPKPGLHATVSVKRGAASWVMWLDRLKDPAEVVQYERAWSKFIVTSSNLSDGEKDTVVARSRAFGQMEEIRQGLIGKGLLASN